MDPVPPERTDTWTELSLRIGLSVSQLHRVLHQAGLPQTPAEASGLLALPSYVRPYGDTGRAWSVQTDLHTSQVSKQKDLQRQQTGLSVRLGQRTEQPLVPGWVSRITRWMVLVRSRKGASLSGVQYMHGLEFRK